MKKRYIVLGLLALEALMLPFAGHTFYKSGLTDDLRKVFETPQRAVNVKLPSEPGFSRFIVFANAPFAISTKDMVGPVTVKLHAQGTVNGNVFGENAQIPGQNSSCGTFETTDTKIIYASEKGTIAGEGSILSQSILVEVQYDASQTPEVKILTQDKSEDLPAAETCAHSKA